MEFDCLGSGLHCKLLLKIVKWDIEKILNIDVRLTPSLERPILGPCLYHTARSACELGTI